MIRQSSSAGPCKYLHNENKKLCKIFAKERRKKKKKKTKKNRITLQATILYYSEAAVQSHPFVSINIIIQQQNYNTRHQKGLAPPGYNTKIYK